MKRGYKAVSKYAALVIAGAIRTVTEIHLEKNYKILHRLTNTEFMFVSLIEIDEIRESSFPRSVAHIKLLLVNNFQKFSLFCNKAHELLRVSYKVTGLTTQTAQIVDHFDYSDSRSICDGCIIPPCK